MLFFVKTWKFCPFIWLLLYYLGLEWDDGKDNVVVDDDGDGGDVG